MVSITMSTIVATSSTVCRAQPPVQSAAHRRPCIGSSAEQTSHQHGHHFSWSRLGAGWVRSYCSSNNVWRTQMHPLCPNIYTSQRSSEHLSRIIGDHWAARKVSRLCLRLPCPAALVTSWSIGCKEGYISGPEFYRSA